LSLRCAHSKTRASPREQKARRQRPARPPGARRCRRLGGGHRQTSGFPGGGEGGPKSYTALMSGKDMSPHTGLIGVGLALAWLAGVVAHLQQSVLPSVTV